MNRCLNVTTAGKSAIFRVAVLQGLQGHHFPTGRVAGRGTGSHGPPTGCPRWRAGGATAGGTAESRTTSGRAAASEDGEGTCRTRATGQQIPDVIFREVEEWDFE